MNCLPITDILHATLEILVDKSNSLHIDPLQVQVASCEDPEHGRQGQTYSDYSMHSLFAPLKRTHSWFLSMGERQGGYSSGFLTDVVAISEERVVAALSPGSMLDFRTFYDDYVLLQATKYGELEFSRENKMGLGLLSILEYSEGPWSRHRRIENGRYVYNNGFPLLLSRSILKVLSLPQETSAALALSHSFLFRG